MSKATKLNISCSSTTIFIHKQKLSIFFIIISLCLQFSSYGLLRMGQDANGKLTLSGAATENMLKASQAAQRHLKYDGTEQKAGKDSPKMTKEQYGKEWENRVKQDVTNQKLAEGKSQSEAQAAGQQAGQQANQDAQKAFDTNLNTLPDGTGIVKNIFDLLLQSGGGKNGGSNGGGGSPQSSSPPDLGGTNVLNSGGMGTSTEPQTGFGGSGGESPYASPASQSPQAGGYEQLMSARSAAPPSTTEFDTSRNVNAGSPSSNIGRDTTMSSLFSSPKQQASTESPTGQCGGGSGSSGSNGSSSSGSGSGGGMPQIPQIPQQQQSQQNNQQLQNALTQLANSQKQLTDQMAQLERQRQEELEKLKKKEEELESELQKQQEQEQAEKDSATSHEKRLQELKQQLDNNEITAEQYIQKLKDLASDAASTYNKEGMTKDQLLTILNKIAAAAP